MGYVIFFVSILAFFATGHWLCGLIGLLVLLCWFHLLSVAQDSIEDRNHERYLLLSDEEKLLIAANDMAESDKRCREMTPREYHDMISATIRSNQ